jgi:hypothetical protein
MFKLVQYGCLIKTTGLHWIFCSSGHRFISRGHRRNSDGLQKDGTKPRLAGHSKTKAPNDVSGQDRPFLYLIHFDAVTGESH